MFKKIVLGLSLLVAGCQSKVYQAPPVEHMVNIVPVKKINWMEMNPTSLELAKENNKLIMVFFYRKDCEWCDKMQRTTFRDPCVVEELNKNYVAIGVDANANPQLVTTFLDLPIYPTTLFALPDSTVIPSNLHGYVPGKDFCELLQGLKSVHAASQTVDIQKKSGL